jgi:hypothetical protein
VVALVCDLQECRSCSSGRVFKPNEPVEYVPWPPRIRLSAPGRMRYPRPWRWLVTCWRCDYGLMGLWILDDPMEIILASCQVCSLINKTIWSWRWHSSDKWALRICLKVTLRDDVPPWWSLIFRNYQRSQGLFPTTSADTSPFPLVVYPYYCSVQKSCQSPSAQLGWNSGDGSVR